jgi:hypothetical protein
MTGTAAVAIDPQAPEAPAAPAGPNSVYTGSNPTTDYTTSGGMYATTYTWQVSPSDAGAASGSGLTATITWDQAYEGPAMVSVQGVNTCGGGSFSTEFTVDVHPGFVGIGETGKHYFSIYPNPVKDVLTITSSEMRQADITVINAIGRTLISLPAQTISSTYQLDLNNLAPGVYTLMLKMNGNLESFKVVVK